MQRGEEIANFIDNNLPHNKRMHPHHEDISNSQPEIPI